MDGRTPHGLVYVGPRNCAAVVYIRVMQLCIIISINRSFGDQFLWVKVRVGFSINSSDARESYKCHVNACVP